MTTNPTLAKAARKAAIRTKPGSKITGETIRTRVQEMGVDAPAPSAWGGVIQSLVRSGILKNTGETTRMISPQARGRKSPVYERQAVRS